MATAYDVQIAALETAINTGALTVKYGENSVTYRSQSELLAALSRLKAQAGVEARPRGGFASFSRGDT